MSSTASTPLRLRWVLLSVGVTLAYALGTLLDAFTTMRAYHHGIVDADPYTRQVIAVFTVNGWVAMRGVLVLPAVLLVILAPHLMPARWRLAYLLVVSALTLTLAAVQAAVDLHNLAVLATLR